MGFSALSTFVFLVGLVLLAYNGYREDFGDPGANTLVVAIPLLIAAVVLMALAIWRVSSRGWRAASVRVGLGVLVGLIPFIVIGSAILYS
jgi:hypothetical protein